MTKTDPARPASEYPPELLSAARAVNPDTEPHELLSDTNLFLNHIMARAELDVICVAEGHYTKAQFQTAYEQAPSDLYVPPTWEYWGIRLFCNPKYKPPPAGYPQRKYAQQVPAQPVPDGGYPPELVIAAKIVNWYTKPEMLIPSTDLFLNQVMARGRPEDVQAALKHHSIEQFRAAYELAPPGLYGPVTWAYWGRRLFGDPKYKENPVRFPGIKPWHHRSL